MLLGTFTPDDAFARRGGGMRAGGVHGGAVRAGGYRGGTVAARGYRGGAVAVHGGRYGYRGAGAHRGYRYGAGVAAAPVGAAAAGTYHRGGCGYDAYGNWVCPGGHSPY